MMMNFSTLSRRLRTSWHPVGVTLRPMVGSKAAGPSANMWVPGFDEALQAWGQWCEANHGACVSLGLSARWLMVAVGDDAPATWQHYYGMSPEVLGADWIQRSVPVGSTPLHCAAPSGLIKGIQEAAAQHHVQLQWVGPWWSHELERHMADLALNDMPADAWATAEPGLRIHATLARDADKPKQVHLQQLWCETLDDATAAQAALLVCNAAPLVEAA